MTGVQKGFYLNITVKNDREIISFDNVMRDVDFRYEKLTKQETVNVLRAFFLRNFQEFPITVFKEEVNVEYENLKQSKKKKQLKIVIVYQKLNKDYYLQQST